MSYGRRTLTRLAGSFEKRIDPTTSPIYLFFANASFTDLSTGTVTQAYGNYLSRKRKWVLGRLGRHLGGIDAELWVTDPWRTVSEVIAKMRAAAGMGYWGAGIQ